jgi:hypothetical protein
MFRGEFRRFWVWTSFGLYLAMITANTLANVLPINGITTGAVSDSYFNLFAPTGLTFSIWGVIYLLLGIYVFVQLRGLWRKEGAFIHPSSVRINAWFAISSFANTLWIFAWHYRVIWLSLVFMLIVLVSLMMISFPLRNTDTLTKAAFGIYFGWICVATIANVTTLLVRYGVPGNTVGATIQTSIVLLVGLLIGGITLWIQQNIGFGLTFIWAYLGIYWKHVDPAQFDRGYAAVFNTALFAIVVLTLLVAWIVAKPYLKRVYSKPV